jgi:non-specific serine/threonine protein kinase/serine/threonine-protein kinase PknK
MSLSGVSTSPSKPVIAGHFELGEFINQGGMGAVYKGRDQRTGQTVAIKHLKREVVGADSGLIERFVREGEALRALNHPNIVKLLGADKLDTGHYLVMEYVGGGSLAELLARHGKLSVERTLRIGLELSDALARAHYLRIIHRDLKPANILLTEDGTPRLTDFGVARIGDSDMTGTGIIIGTFAYLPPEVVNGESVDTRADVWSFGVLLFEMLTGKRPFDGDSPGAQMAAIMTRPTPDLEALRPDTPIALVDLIYRMLEKDRDQRINSMRLVGAELEAILSGQSTPTPRTPTPISNNAPTITPTPTRSANNLPTQTTPFVGREDELAEIGRLLSDPNIRLVTILGPGGMGKTRLALEAAARTDFLHGAHFVSLAPCDSKEQIMNALAEAIKFQFARGADLPMHQLADFLRDKTMLLVMDNFEHLLSDAGMVEQFLENCPSIKLLITSRERLNIQAETVFRIEGMDIPDPFKLEEAANHSAVKLFLQGARRADPSFKLEAENLPNIARICSQVQGLPLGILLAASWVGMLSLREIADEIEKSLDFLESEQRDLPTRQRSMRAVFDYSWNLLTEDERDAFKALAVFRGGFSRESAQEVTGASLRTLTALVNKSLLRRTHSGRFEVHELLRQYAESKLNETPDTLEQVRHTHMEHFLNYLDWEKQKSIHMEHKRKHQQESEKMLKQMAAEIDNVLAAWNHAVEHHDYAKVAQVIENFWFYCFLTDRSLDGERAFRTARDAFRMDQPSGLRGALYAMAMAATAFFQAFNGNRTGVKEALSKADTTLQSCGTDAMQAFVPTIRGLMMALASELLDDSYTTLQAYCQRAYDVAQRGNNPWDRGLASFLLSSAERFTGNLEASQRHAEECLALSQQIDEDGLRSFAEVGLAMIAWVRGDYLVAKEHFEMALKTLTHIMPRDSIAQIKINLALILPNLSEFEQSKRYALEAATYFRDVKNQIGVVRSISALGWNAEAQGNQAEAIQHFNEALTIARKTGNPAWIANELANLGRPTARLGRYDEAERIYREALTLARTANDDLTVNMALTWLAYLRGKRGLVTPAVEILSFILTQPNSSELVRDAESHLAEFGVDLVWDVYRDAMERGKTRTLESVFTEILENR